ncbi:MAG: hypothetical protein HRT88_01785 [Lentisphaeraceae bacterium]|nr:hypothetical protein [Lentisphaeraceae bacterium]
MNSTDKKNDHRKNFFVALYDKTFELQEKSQEQESPERHEFLAIVEEGPSKKSSQKNIQDNKRTKSRNENK